MVAQTVALDTGGPGQPLGDAPGAVAVLLRGAAKKPIVTRRNGKLQPFIIIMLQRGFLPHLAFHLLKADKAPALAQGTRHAVP
jgi:hypothetical protein